MEISVRQLSVKPKYIRQLLNNGIVLASHLNAFDTARLAARTRLTLDECEEILSKIKPRKPYYTFKASEFMIQPIIKLSTPMKDLDYILNGGIRCRQLAEITGEAGAGKSNFCAEIATLVMMPNYLGGRDEDVLLIHTEGEGKLRLCLRRFQTLETSIEENSWSCPEKLHVINCSNEFQLAEIANRLPDEIDKHNIRLVIIDSITCAFLAHDVKPNREYYVRRGLRLTRIVKTLVQVAWDKKVAILITNHVSYDPDRGYNKPALGKLWSHMCQTRIYLERKGDRRIANVIKGASNEPKPVEFSISAYLASDRKQN